jgi:hypothetical protein
MLLLHPKIASISSAPLRRFFRFFLTFLPLSSVSLTVGFCWMAASSGRCRLGPAGRGSSAAAVIWEGGAVGGGEGGGGSRDDDDRGGVSEASTTLGVERRTVWGGGRRRSGRDTT